VQGWLVHVPVIPMGLRAQAGGAPVHPPAAVLAPGTASQPPPMSGAPTAARGDHVNASGEFTGPLMTHNEKKGWERVAIVQSEDWPADVPKSTYASPSLL
jgi:hypothetical protein